MKSHAHKSNNIMVQFKNTATATAILLDTIWPPSNGVTSPSSFNLCHIYYYDYYRIYREDISVFNVSAIPLTPPICAKTEITFGFSLNSPIKYDKSSASNKNSWSLE